jgi:LDH2 family malate/lactate/ureidoglycolate dehydrogenase
MLGTNPISVAAPAGRHFPFVLDMATSTVAIGKLSIARRWGQAIPAGWALDDEGQPTTDPNVAYETRLLTPLGATRDLGGHKGYGLAVMVDILSGVLAGAGFADVRRRREPDPTRADIGHFFGAIDITRFRDLAAFKIDMDDLLHALKDSPKADGQDRIYVAGEPEWECEQRRRREGIPLAPGLAIQLQEVAAEVAISFALGA